VQKVSLLIILLTLNDPIFLPKAKVKSDTCFLINLEKHVAPPSVAKNGKIEEKGNLVNLQNLQIVGSSNSVLSAFFITFGC